MSVYDDPRDKRLRREDTELKPVKGYVQPEVADVKAEFEKARIKKRVQEASRQPQSMVGEGPKNSTAGKIDKVQAATSFAKDIGGTAGYGAEGETDVGAGVMGGALSGAATGAALGSIVPGPGNAIGAVVGAVVGGVAGGFGASANYKDAVERGKAKAKAEYHSSMRQIEQSRDQKVQNALTSLKRASGNILNDNKKVKL